MFYVSNIFQSAPQVFSSVLQEKTYQTLAKLKIAFSRVETDEAITMEDCVIINQKLEMEMVKTLFLCNRQQTKFYLFVTKGDKTFSSKDFSHALGIPRVSFAPEVLMEEMLGTKIGAATVFSALLDQDKQIKIVFDQAVLSQEWYGCSDGTTTGYMKVKTTQIIEDFLNDTNHQPLIIQV
ncbi:prolyl-tRNA synthetase associated domain-containing protein [Fundicoccus culcitae]|uniref:Prolyl-tRNA synthetase associated domain-containing protein n=1 Tax=Fundicoccus culcitae TaxID=2969821 RepID=A0ABY5P8T9_9LACT|nr:YbaK/EbsC family protein [Fundicoccus culcitae]UUX34785.1 prolyl-tRNA synthetase associated domain-containing protein [Fundicoccus culcitae]